MSRPAASALFAALTACGMQARADNAAAVMLQDAGPPPRVLYRPAALDSFGGAHRLPIVVWGNGGCSDRGNSAQPFLTAIAAHGYVAIALGTIKAGPLGPPPLPPGAVSGTGAPPPGGPPQKAATETAQLRDTLTWVIAQDTAPGSPYFGKLDTHRIAAMGTSCGGLQAIELGPDARVKTVATFSSGLLDRPRPGANATRDTLRRLHGPILYVVGGPTDGAAPHAKTDFDGINSVPVVLAQNAPAGHGAPLIQPNGGAWAPVATAWLDWQLKGDRRAAKTFRGADCSLCTQPGWTVRSKGFYTNRPKF